MTITGACGHTAPFDEFTTTPINGDLPAGQYQCPICKQAFRMVPVEAGRRYTSGLVIPPKCEVMPCPTTL